MVLIPKLSSWISRNSFSKCTANRIKVRDILRNVIYRMIFPHIESMTKPFVIMSTHVNAIGMKN